MLLAACGGGSSKKLSEISPVQMQADAAVVTSLIEAERTAVVAYGLATKRLTGDARSLATRLMRQETEHERALESELRALGGSVSARRRTSDYASGLPKLTGPDWALRLGLDVENTQVAAYSDALGTVATPSLKATITAILAAEGAHLSVILGRLHQPQTPQALVTGSRPT